MELGDGDRREHFPYVREGFAVLSYSLDGHLDREQNGDVLQVRRAAEQFLAARCGLTNAEIALEWLAAKVPEVDPGRIYTAGHSSVGTMALLLAENNSRIKGCVAYDGRSDVEANFHGQTRALRQVIPRLDEFITTYNPKLHADRISVPVLLFHARDDSVVPVTESEAFATTLREQCKKVSLAIVPEGEHYDAMISQGIPMGIAWIKAIDRGEEPAGDFGALVEAPNAAAPGAAPRSFGPPPMAPGPGFGTFGPPPMGPRPGFGAFGPPPMVPVPGPRFLNGPGAGPRFRPPTRGAR
jgi:dienelactone hydrolase